MLKREGGRHVKSLISSTGICVLMHTSTPHELKRMSILSKLFDFSWSFLRLLSNYLCRSWGYCPRAFKVGGAAVPDAPAVPTPMIISLDFWAQSQFP